MFMYILEKSGHNNLDYEDYYHFNEFRGVFSTVEKAKECAENLIKEIKSKHPDDEDGYPTFQITKEWHDGDDNSVVKTIQYDVDIDSYETMTIYYTITKVEVDKED